MSTQLDHEQWVVLAKNVLFRTQVGMSAAPYFDEAGKVIIAFCGVSVSDILAYFIGIINQKVTMVPSHLYECIKRSTAKPSQKLDRELKIKLSPDYMRMNGDMCCQVLNTPESVSLYAVMDTRYGVEEYGTVEEVIEVATTADEYFARETERAVAWFR